MKIWMSAVSIPLALAGCTTAKLNNALGTPKNPTPIFQNPNPEKGKVASQDAIITPLYNVLLEASTATDELKVADAGDQKIRRYLGAGFALSDVYCSRFFIHTDEAYRRRRFGRTLTNDVGTVMTTVLGLANAGENVVTGLAAAVGFADSAWRNYDDSFVVSPDLSNVQSLVFAAQDNFRARTLAKDATLPTDYGTAQSVILRYANLCTFLGMKGMLDQSAAKQKNELNADTEAVNKPAAKAPAKPVAGAVAQPAATPERPDIATPSLAPNKPL